LDLSTARKLEAALERLRAPVVLDLSEVSFINSVGLVLLLRVTRNGVTIGEVSPAVTRLLRLNGFEDEVLRPPGELTSGLT
jgi:anti-anti-sigma factor